MLHLQAFSCLLLLTKNRAVKGYRMLAFRVVFEFLQVQSGHALVLSQRGKAEQQLCQNRLLPPDMQVFTAVVHMAIIIPAAVDAIALSSCRHA